MMIIINLVILILVGCTQKTDETGNQSEDKSMDQVEDAIKIFEVDSTKFHFVVDWLTDTKVVFVEKDTDKYLLRTFDITTGKIETLYEETSIILDALIHPSKNTYLLHTSDDSSSATIKIISLEGVVLDEISIASSELAIEWNDTDPTLLLLTAFQKDWSYDVFLYSGNEVDISLLSLEDPFPKWLGRQKVITLNVPEQPLGGGELLLYDLELGTEEHLDLEGVVHFDTNGDNLLIVQINGENADYKIIDQDGTVLSKWSMPAVSSYSEWVFSEMSWVSDTTIFMTSTSEGGRLDDLREPFHLVRVANGRQDVLIDNVTTDILRCSPNGEKCLAGPKAEKIIDIQKQEEFIWINETE